MDSEERLNRQLEVIKEAGKENKNVDVAALMVAALERHHEHTVSTKTKRWAYLVSLLAPPFGLLFAIKLYFADEDDARHVALNCVVLTTFSIFMLVLTIKLMFSTAGISPSQIEQIKPQDVYQLTQ